MPIIHAGAAEALVVYLETIGTHEVKATVGVGAQAPDVAGVLGNLGPKKYEVNHRWREFLRACSASRWAERFLRSSRLSWIFLPVPTPSCTFTKARLK